MWFYTKTLFIFQSIKIGDVLIGQVQQKNFHGLIFRVVATEDSTILRDVRELSIKVLNNFFILHKQFLK